MIVYLNDGLGGFEEFQILSETNGSISTIGAFTRQSNVIKTGDLDNDGFNEIIHVRYAADHINVIDNFGLIVTEGTINRTPHYSPITNVQTYDINKDGVLDVIPYGSGGASIHLGNANGTIEKDPIYTIEEQGLSNIQFLDFDDDGNIDVIVNADSVNDEGSRVSFSTFLFANNGDETFSKSKILSWDEAQSDINFIYKFRDAIDFDNDGDNDLVFGACLVLKYGYRLKIDLRCF